MPKLIDIMEQEQAYAASKELLPFVSDMSKDKTLIISQHAAEFYPCPSE